MPASPARRASRSPRRPDLATRRTPDTENSARAPRAVRAQLPGEAEFEHEYPGSSFLAVAASSELERVGFLIAKMIGELTKRYQLSHAGLNALAVVEGNAAPIASGELAERMHVSSGTTTSLIDNLERRGLVVRLTDPDDRRRVLIDITPAAQELLDELLPEVSRLMTHLFGQLSDSKLIALRATLDDIRASMDAFDGEITPSTRNRPSHLTRQS